MWEEKPRICEREKQRYKRHGKQDGNASNPECIQIAVSPAFLLQANIVIEFRNVDK